MTIMYAFMILLMYFLSGLSKATHFSQTVGSFKKMFFLSFLLVKRISTLFSRKVNLTYFVKYFLLLYKIRHNYVLLLLSIL